MVCVEPIRDKKKIEVVKRILKERGSRDYLLFLMGINSGLRISDILKLKVADVKDKKYIELTDTGKKYYDYYNELYEGIKNYFSSKGINDSGDNYVWLFISKINEEDIKKLIRKA